MEWGRGDVSKDSSWRIKMDRGRGNQAGKNPELRTGFTELQVADTLRREREGGSGDEEASVYCT